MRRLLLLLIALLLGFTSWTLWITSERTNQRLQADQAEQGQAQIGGDFTLTDQNGRIVHEADFHGRLMLVFFGFTHCPDICPVTVANMSKAMALLGLKADQVTPIFVSLDPERDTPPVLKDFLSNFDKRFVGLTGTSAQVKDIADDYKVYYAKHPMPAMAGMAAQQMKNDYSVDHSAFIYIMGKDGKFIQVLPNSAGAEEIARVVKRILG